MSESGARAVPAARSRVERFERGLAAGELMLSACCDCDSRQLPPRDVCDRCQSPRFTWKPSTGRGRVWSKVEFHKQYLPEPPVPYTVVLVELDDGGLVYGLSSVPYDDLALGATLDFIPHQSTAGTPTFGPRRTS